VSRWIISLCLGRAGLVVVVGGHSVIQRWSLQIMASKDDEFAAPVAPGQFGADIAGARKFLTGHGWPQGLQNALCSTLDDDILRFWIVDNSGSMNSDDGSKFTINPDGSRLFDVLLFFSSMLI
jgi:hypothetical protein